MRRLRSVLADSGPVIVLAAIAAVGSFTHISALAAAYGQPGWQAWAVAVCIDLMCVMAARELQRDKRTGRPRRGLLSWPALVLAGGITLTLAANLAEAHPSPWGWIVAATPAGAFLIAMSMLERRASHHPPTSAPVPAPFSMPLPVPETVTAERDDYPSAAASASPELMPAPPEEPSTDESPAPEVPGDALLAYAQHVAEEHRHAHGALITPAVLSRRIRVTPEVAAGLLAQISATSVT
ncbi:DUF2637 domain-containing protein [Streptosporangium canum]|uniref:DUF2637 domain-containing protein n=1 Tax=Streptosporangium canum TaxID=324952 RepID=UPI0034338664